MKVIPIGMYRGRRFSDIAARDPSYLNWLVISASDPEVRSSAAEALSAFGASLEGPVDAGAGAGRRQTPPRPIRSGGHAVRRSYGHQQHETEL